MEALLETRPEPRSVLCQFVIASGLPLHLGRWGGGGWSALRHGGIQAKPAFHGANVSRKFAGPRAGCKDEHVAERGTDTCVSMICAYSERHRNVPDK